MIVLRSPKGWTGPREVDGVPIEGTFRAHQVPLSGVRDDPAHLAMLEAWMRSYRPEELFDDEGRPTTGAQDPTGQLRLSAAPQADAGASAAPLVLRDLRSYAVDVTAPGVLAQESTRRLGRMLRDVYVDNPSTFRLFCPDETVSNRLGDVLDSSDRAFMERLDPADVHLSHTGRVMEVLSEHSCHGWLEGYTLTGRYGLFATYEAFAMVSASQTVQHSKWLEAARALEWRAPVPSLNVLLTSTAWRNDHNGFSHQGPGLIQVMLTHRGSVTRIYLPPDANCLLSVAEHCLGSHGYVNLIVIDKQPQLQYLDLEAAEVHCAAGAGIWEWAGTEAGTEDGTAPPDVVLACAGDTPTLETVAAAQILREHCPRLRTRVVNVVDLMSLVRPADHPHGLEPEAFTALFTDDVDVVFAFHGFPGAVHQLVHGRPDPGRFHVRGYVEQGTTTTPFDMTVLNQVSRFHLVLLALRSSRVRPAGAQELEDWCRSKLAEHHAYVREHMEDLPEIRDWRVEARAPVQG